MNASNAGEIRPMSSIAESAIIQAKSATAILDKSPSPEAINNAAKELIKAGLALLMDSTESAYILPEQYHADIFGDLVNCKCALELVLTDEDSSAGVQAVISLVVEKLERHIDELDAVTLHLAGLDITLDKADHE